MEEPTHAERWERLLGLLAPLHVQALATARRLCRSAAEGDDLYQEAVLRAFQKLLQLRDEGRFRSWFFAVLLSVHRGRCRRAFWRRFLPLADVHADGFNLEGDDGRQRADEHEQAVRASRALATLPAVQREAVVLHDIETFSMAEIAAMQGVTVSAVKTRVARGRERLRAHYRRLGLEQHPVSRLVASAQAASAPERQPPVGWTASRPPVRRESS
jgi:RNA polymerase sigma-70 factor, ECF subfamily